MVEIKRLNPGQALWESGQPWAGFSNPFGVFRGGKTEPTVETTGYSQLFLRDKIHGPSGDKNWDAPAAPKRAGIGWFRLALGDGRGSMAGILGA